MEFWTGFKHSKFVLLALLFTTSGFSTSGRAATPQVIEGRYLTRTAGCADCHTVSSDQEMAGGYALVTPVGTFYTPNLTPDPETGIGKWTKDDFRTALRWGISPKGYYYYPTFPYRSFTKMTDADIDKIFAYLNSLPAVHKPNREHDVSLMYSQRWSIYFWDELAFRWPTRSSKAKIRAGRGPFAPDPQHSVEWNRGAYLVEALLHCAECHTPRSPLQLPRTYLWMAGSDIALSGKFPPNITPDLETGLGYWTKDNWIRFLQSGFTPENYSPSGEMAQVIQNTSALTPADRAAVATYMMSLKPIHRQDKQ